MRVLTAVFVWLVMAPSWVLAADTPKDITGNAPALAGRDIDGKRFKLEKALEQGPVVITFWTTWCRPCRKEMPELEKLRRKYEDRGLQIVAVSGDGPVDQAKVKPYIKAQKFKFIVLSDLDGEIRRRFQVEVFPTSFLIDQENRIVHRSVGYRRGDEKVLETHILGILSPEATGESSDNN